MPPTPFAQEAGGGGGADSQCGKTQLYDYESNAKPILLNGARAIAKRTWRRRHDPSARVVFVLAVVGKGRTLELEIDKLRALLGVLEALGGGIGYVCCVLNSFAGRCSHLAAGEA